MPSDMTVDNYRVFQGLLPSLLNTARGKWVLLYNQQDS